MLIHGSEYLGHEVFFTNVSSHITNILAQKFRSSITARVIYTIIFSRLVQLGPVSMNIVRRNIPFVNARAHPNMALWVFELNSMRIRESTSQKLGSRYTETSSNDTSTRVVRHIVNGEQVSYYRRRDQKGVYHIDYRTHMLITRRLQSIAAFNAEFPTVSP